MLGLMFYLAVMIIGTLFFVWLIMAVFWGAMALAVWVLAKVLDAFGQLAEACWAALRWLGSFL